MTKANLALSVTFALATAAVALPISQASAGSKPNGIPHSVSKPKSGLTINIGSHRQLNFKNRYIPRLIISTENYDCSKQHNRDTLPGSSYIPSQYKSCRAW